MRALPAETPVLIEKALCACDDASLRAAFADPQRPGVQDALALTFRTADARGEEVPAGGAARLWGVRAIRAGRDASRRFASLTMCADLGHSSRIVLR